MKRFEKARFFLTLIVFPVFLVFCLILTIPKHFYQLALKEGLQSPFLSLQKLPRPFYSSSLFKLDESSKESGDSMWKMFHVSNYNVPFPVRHPLYLTIPILEWKNDSTLLGYKLLSYKGRELASVRFLGVKKLKFDFKNNKVFTLPVFKADIFSKGSQDVWIDLFKMNIERDLDTDFQLGEEIFVTSLREVKDMVKKLFIIHNRSKFFPVRMEKIMHWPKRNFGVVLLSSEEGIQPQSREMIYLLKGNRIHLIELRTLNGNLPAKEFRRRFFTNLEYKKSTSESSIPLYNGFLELDYKRKNDQEGMIHLFSAWGHSLDNRNYLDKIIFTLRRKKGHSLHLQPFYEYMVKRFEDRRFLKYVPFKGISSEKLKRKIAEEIQEDIEKARREEFLTTEGKFKSTKEKAKFYLDRAKETSLEKDPNTLIEE